MHYGEFAIRTYYLALFIFSAFGALFILLPFLFKDALKKAKIVSILLGIIILLLSILFLFTADPSAALRLFRF